jgi:hypothetical protein
MRTIMKLLFKILLVKRRKPAISIWLLLFSLNLLVNLLPISYSGEMKGKHLTLTTSIPVSIIFGKLQFSCKQYNTVFHVIIKFPVVPSVERNSSEHITAVGGTSSDILNWLTLRYDFSYDFLNYANSVKW